MIKNENFKYLIKKRSITGTEFTHRTLTIAEAINYFLILLEQTEDEFEGFIAIYKENGPRVQLTNYASVDFMKKEKATMVSINCYIEIETECDYLKDKLVKL